MKAAAKRTKKKTETKLKKSVFCGTSLDGFLARPDDTFDFLTAGEGVPHGFVEFLASVDVIVLGRRTFDVVMKLGHLGLYGKKRIVVLSRRPLDFPDVKGATLEQMAGTPQEIVAQLEATGAKHAYVDGGITIQDFLRAGEIDRIIVTRVPVLIGTGIPLFGEVPHDLHLRHIATRSFPSGLVQSEYAIGGAEEKKGRTRRPVNRRKKKKNS